MNKFNDTAVVFPGQGTQRHGMGQEFFNQFPESRSVYEEASDALGWDVAALCFGDDDKLHLTEFAQPCILTTEMAMYRCLQENHGFNPARFGGHSLGEYTALTAAGVIPLSDAVQIVHTRGGLMQKSCPEGTGGMAAVISDSISRDDLENIIDDLEVDIANINSANQIVISGDKGALDTVEQRLDKTYGEGDVRFVKLEVSAAFHSRFMTTMVNEFKQTLDSFSNRFDASCAGMVTSNVSGGLHTDNVADVLDNLARQVDSPVLWRHNMDTLSSSCETIYELGPARPLTAFFKSQGVSCTPLTSAKKAEKYLKN